MREAALRTGAGYTAERTARETVRVFQEYRAGKTGCGEVSAGDEETLGKLTRGDIPEGWEEVRHSRTARVVRGALSDGRDVFYKEFLPRDVFEGVKSVFRGSRARRAQRGGALLRSKGLGAPQTIRAGSLPGGRSYLLSEAAPGVSVEDYYRRHFAGEERGAYAARKREFIRALGREVAKLHQRCIVHGDLGGYNILVQETGGGWSIHFIDNEGTRPSSSEAARERNLVQIGTNGLPGLTIRDRMRFFVAYRDARSGTLASWKRTAASVYQVTVRRLRKRGRSL
jgi:tRNA A-37 threonylcarbamoyl transferase component Bud32